MLAAAANDLASVDPAVVAVPIEWSGVPLPPTVVPVSATEESALADPVAVDLAVGDETAVELPSPPEHLSPGRFPSRPASTNPVAAGGITGVEEVISVSGSVAAEIAAGTDAPGAAGVDLGGDLGDDATDGSAPSDRDGSQSRTTSAPADGRSLQPSAARALRPAASVPAGERDADGSRSMTTSTAARVTGPPLGGVSLSLPSLSVDLSEEGLGPLRLRALNGAGVVHLELTASDPVITDLLVRAGHELRRDLEASGTAVGDLHIAQGNPGGGDRGSSGSDSRYWQDPSSDDQRRSAPATTPSSARRLITLEHLAIGRSDSSTSPNGVDLLI